MNVTVFPRFFLQQFNILGSLGTNYTSEGQAKELLSTETIDLHSHALCRKKFKLRLENSLIIGNGAMVMI